MFVWWLNILGFDWLYNEFENREKYVYEIYLDGNGVWCNRNKSKGIYIYMILCLLVVKSLKCK